MRSGILGGEPLQALLVLKDAGDLVRQRLQFGDEGRVARLVDLFARFGKLHRQEIARDQLRRIRLGGGHGDLRACQRVKDVVRLAGDGTAHHVDDAQRRHALRLRFPQRRQAVRRLARLADDDHQLVRPQKRLAVAELRGQIHLHRQAGQVLDDVFRRHAHVVGRTAGNKV